MPLGETATAPSGSIGVVASACLEEEIVETREALAVVARDHQPESGDGLAWAVEGHKLWWPIPRPIRQQNVIHSGNDNIRIVIHRIPSAD